MQRLSNSLSPIYQALAILRRTANAHHWDFGVSADKVAAGAGMTASQFLTAFPLWHLFQESTGVTPAYLPTHPVGLVLDQPKGVVELGAELVPTTALTTTVGWIATNSTVAIVGSELEITSSGAGFAYADLTISTPTKFMRVNVGCRMGASGGTSATASAANALGTSYVPVVTSQSTVLGTCVYDKPNGDSKVRVLINATASGQKAYFSFLSIREVIGSHASQSTTTKRPVLSARVNLLVATEDFSTTWTKTAVTVAPNAVAAPDGTTTADKVIATNTASTTRAVYQNFTPVSGASYTVGFYAKAAEYSNLCLSEIYGGRFGATFDLVAQTSASLGGAGFVSSSITPVGGGWYRCVVSATGGASGWALAVTGYPVGATVSAGGCAYAGDGTSGLYLWGADLRPSNSPTNIPAYQRVTSATDYDTAGFPLRAVWDGIDDCLVVPTLDLSFTDKVTVIAGLTQQAGQSIALELSASANTNNGSFYLYANNGALDVQLKTTNGTNFTNTATSTPLGKVFSGQFDIAGASASTEIAIRVNGSAGAGAYTGTEGAGNFGAAYPLYIGQRGGASLPFSGAIQSITLLPTLITASETATLESWVNNSMGKVY
jgi:hypothetical protein